MRVWSRLPCLWPSRRSLGDHLRYSWPTLGWDLWKPFQSLCQMLCNNLCILHWWILFHTPRLLVSHHQISLCRGRMNGLSCPCSQQRVATRLSYYSLDQPSRTTYFTRLLSLQSALGESRQGVTWSSWSPRTHYHFDKWKDEGSSNSAGRCVPRYPAPFNPPRILG